MTGRELAETIDWQVIGEELYSLKSDQLVVEDALHRAVAGVIEWGPRCVGRIVSIEETKRDKLLGIPWEWTCDVVLKNPSEILDYKSFYATKLSRWEREMSQTPQADVYMECEGISKLTYCGISSSWKTHQVVRDVSNHRLSLAHQRAKVMWDKRGTRIKNHKSCYAYGRPCPWMDTCHINNDPTEALPELPLHQSWVDQWWQCPERWYRGVLASLHDVSEGIVLDSPDSSDAAQLGTLMHLALRRANETIREL